MTMRLLYLLILSISTFVGVAQTNRQTKTPVQILYGESTSDERRRGPISAGILNTKVVSEVLPAYPRKAKDKGIEGRVEVQVLAAGTTASLRPHARAARYLCPPQ